MVRSLTKLPVPRVGCFVEMLALLCFQHPTSSSQGRGPAGAEAERFRGDRRPSDPHRSAKSPPPPSRSSQQQQHRASERGARDSRDSRDGRGDHRDRERHAPPGERSRGGGADRGGGARSPRDRSRERERGGASGRGGGRPSSTSQPAMMKSTSSGDKDPMKLSGQKASIKMTLVNKVG